MLYNISPCFSLIISEVKEEKATATYATLVKKHERVH